MAFFLKRNVPINQRSNIIYKDSDVYLIDYEWVLPLSIPVDYVFFRALHLHVATAPLLPNYFSEEEISLFNSMERNLIDNNILCNGFYFDRHRYLKKNYLVGSRLLEREQLLEQKDDTIVGQYRQIVQRDTWIRERNRQVTEQNK